MKLPCSASRDLLQPCVRLQARPIFPSVSLFSSAITPPFDKLKVSSSDEGHLPSDRGTVFRSTPQRPPSPLFAWYDVALSARPQFKPLLAPQSLGSVLLLVGAVASFFPSRPVLLPRHVALGVFSMTPIEERQLGPNHCPVSVPFWSSLFILPPGQLFLPSSLFRPLRPFMACVQATVRLFPFPAVQLVFRSSLQIRYLPSRL